MTREELLSMAREAGFIVRNNMARTIHSNGSWIGVTDELAKFAELVAIRAVAAERKRITDFLTAQISCEIKKIVDCLDECCPESQQ
jgi:hypothetical protein